MDRTQTLTHIYCVAMITTNHLFIYVRTNGLPERVVVPYEIKFQPDPGLYKFMISYDVLPGGTNWITIAYTSWSGFEMPLVRAIEIHLDSTNRFITHQPRYENFTENEVVTIR